MNEERNIGVEFISTAMTTIVIVMSYLLLFIDTGIYISTLLYILPCANEAVRSLAIAKHKMKQRLIIINWAALLASTAVIAACVMGTQLKTITTIPINSIIRVLASIHIIRSIAYVMYFWRKL